MTEPSDDVMNALRAADPVDPGQLPAADNPQAQNLLRQAMADPWAADQQLADQPVHFVPAPQVNRKHKTAAARYRGRGLVAVAAAVVLIVAGFLVFSPNGTTPALAAVHNAAAETAAVRSGRVTTTFDLTGAPTDGTAGSGGGTLNAVFSGQDASVSLSGVHADDPSVADHVQGVESRLVNGVVYVNDGQQWMSLPANGLITSTVSSYLNPRTVLDAVNKLATAEKIGPATMDGVEVTHYRSVVDLGGQSVASWIAGLAPEMEPIKADGQATVDTYIDADGLLRHLDVAGQAKDPAGSGSGTFSVTTVFSDLGSKLSIEAPADAKPFNTADAARLGGD